MRPKSSHVVKTKAGIATMSSEGGSSILVPGPKLRRMIGISAVTLWRWRHDPSMGFPTAKRINGRTFFAWDEIAAWLDKQPNVA